MGVAPNLLDQDFSAQRPDQKWAGDITYQRTTQGWLYLAVVIDLCPHKVIGWASSQRIDAQLACDALKAAIARHSQPHGVILHSDRGSAYCGRQHPDLTRRHGLLASMSGRGNCYENAPVESFFYTLKVESIHREPLVDRATLRRKLFEYIEIDYNGTRRHAQIAA